jgi:hypothetical protein
MNQESGASIRKAARGEQISAAEWAAIPLPQLIVGAVVLHGRFLELGLLAVDDARKQPDEVLAGFRGIVADKARDLDTTLNEMIARSPRDAELLPQAQLNRRVNRMLSREITRRALDRAPASVAMVAAGSTAAQLSEPPKHSRVEGFSMDLLEKGLEIDRLVDYAAPEERDLKNDAVVSAVKKFNQIWQRGWERAESLVAEGWFDAPPQTAAPILDSRRWNRAALYNLAANWVVSGLAPIFLEDPCALPEAARQSYRDSLQKRDAKQRGGTGGRHARAAGTARPKSVTLPFDDLAERELSSGTADIKSDSADEIIEIARAELGPKAALYFEELARGATPKAAAARVGISTGMGRRNLRRMRRLLSESRP